MRTQVHAFFVLTLLLGLGFVGAWVVRHQVHVRRDVTRVLEDRHRRGEDAIDPANIQKLTRFEHAYELALAFGALVLALYGIWMLLSNIWW